MDNDWAYNEVCSVPLWDERCRRSLVSACQRLAENTQLSFSRALGHVRKGVWRILKHPDTTAEGLLSGHVRATARRCREQTYVLVASDTTYMNFTSHKALQELGPISDDTRDRGFLVHSALAISPQGVPLGILHQKSWTRDPKPKQTDPDQDAPKRSYEDKESYKWLEALRGVEKARLMSTPVLLIQDAEADVFDFFAAPRAAHIHLLIRVAQPHRIAIVGDQERSTVRQAVLAAPVEATKTVTIPAKPGQAQRQAVLSLRRSFVRVCPPTSAPAPKPDSVGLWVVAALEENPPDKVEAIDWVLLTTRPIQTIEMASEMIDFYVRRWLIERFHFVLKSGCHFEQLQIDQLSRLEKALSLFSIVAWRLLYLMYLSREHPDAPAEEAVSRLECQVLEQIEDHPITTVGEVILAVAKLGGFRPCPSAGFPGVKSLWLGWRKLSDVIIGYRLAAEMRSP